MIITIDGPVAAGKTSTARQLASLLPITLLDTGAIYRSVALQGLRTNLDWFDETAMTRVASEIDIRFAFSNSINRVWIGGEEVTEAIRSPQVSNGASIVSAHPAVRLALLDLQRRHAMHSDVIAEGRDTGTVVFPDADCKFFLTASPQLRARRRYEELRSTGLKIELDAVVSELEERDHRDSSRAVAPLAVAPDAVLIDSSTLSLDQVVGRILETLPTPFARSRSPNPRTGGS